MSKMFFLLIVVLSSTNSLYPKESKKKLIVLSIDGFPGYYANPDSKFYQYTPNLNKLRGMSNFSNLVTSVYPTMTYPAHTSMITGVDPEVHGIRSNTPFDPYNKNLGGWMWYHEEIKAKTIFNFIKESQKKSASVYWPVSAGAEIYYNIPQYWRAKNSEDEKLVKILSTKGLYEELKKEGITVSEITPDREKVRAGLYIWKKKKPDALFIYTTDLDSAHHTYGVYSNEAKEKLIEIDSLIKEIIEKTSLYSKKNLSFIIVSDHGFKDVSRICYPNTELKQRGYLNLEKNNWKGIFRTMGGISLLLQNDDLQFRFTKNELSSLKQTIESKCEGTKFIYEGKSFEKLKRKFHSGASAFLYSENNTGFGEKTDGDLLKLLGQTFSNHGFLPGDTSMKTILLSYPKNSNYKLKSIKNVLPLSCNWLKIPCNKDEKKK
ncbi:MAG: alkaline phosphatase family protein [Leptospiraceae bacterium]|nr:alkaline phosphatase family protein [Leptospiraceae bacterium]